MVNRDYRYLEFLSNCVKKYAARFYLSLENDICKDYITEKAFNALKLNTIPIILSGANLTQGIPFLLSRVPA